MSGNFGQQQFQRQQFKHKASDVDRGAVDLDQLRQKINLPSFGLIVTAAISIALTLGAAGIGISYSAFQSEGIKDRLVEQMFGRVEQQSGVFGGNKAEQELREKRQAQAQVVVTLMTGGVFILALILCVFYTIALAGGIMMRQFRNYKLCRIACTVALIPILSPLVVVGIPFGIWGLSRLSQADIKNAFSIG